MLFDKSRVYTVVNAEELKPGDKVIVAVTIGGLEAMVSRCVEPVTLEKVMGKLDTCRFIVSSTKSGNISFPLAYLVERVENCTNCGCVHCWYREKHGIDEQRLHTCSRRIEPKTEPKVEKQYRPFVNTDELIKVWCEKGGKWQKRELTMPYVWVRYKTNQCGQKGILITKYEKNYVQIEGDMIAMHALMADYEFLDGSPCGVE